MGEDITQTPWFNLTIKEDIRYLSATIDEVNFAWFYILIFQFQINRQTKAIKTIWSDVHLLT